MSAPRTKKPEAVNHPRHYNVHPSGVECINVVEHMTFNKGNAMKYIWRAGEKGEEAEDLNKAIWYLRREIQLIAKRQANKPPASRPSRPSRSKPKT